jgi:excisionase family DNA binding protein
MNAAEKQDVERIAYTVDEACRATTLGTSTIYELMSAGKLESFRVGRRRLIRADSLRKLVAGEAA